MLNWHLTSVKPGQMTRHNYDSSPCIHRIACPLAEAAPIDLFPLDWLSFGLHSTHKTSGHPVNLELWDHQSGVMLLLKLTSSPHPSFPEVWTLALRMREMYASIALPSPLGQFCSDVLFSFHVRVTHHIMSRSRLRPMCIITSALSQAIERVSDSMKLTHMCIPSD